MHLLLSCNGSAAMPRQTLPPSSKRYSSASRYLHPTNFRPTVGQQLCDASKRCPPSSKHSPLQNGSYASAQPTRLQTESYANPFGTTQPFTAHTFAPQSQPEFPIYVQTNPIEPLIPTFPHTFQPNCQSCQTSYSSHHSARSQIPEPEWGILPPQEVPEEGQIMKSHDTYRHAQPLFLPQHHILMAPNRATSAIVSR